MHCRLAIRRCACACWAGCRWLSTGRISTVADSSSARKRWRWPGGLRDPATLALAIHSRRYAQWGPDNFEQRLADAAQSRTLAFEANELELAVSASRWRFTDLLEDGDVAAADRELDSHAELSERLHQPFLLAHTTQFRASRAIMQGRFHDGESLADDARVQAQRAGNALGRQRVRVADVPGVAAAWRARTARRIPAHGAQIGTAARRDDECAWR